jgi:putative addiction module killer protein
VYEVLRYLSSTGKDIFTEWLAIDRRIIRIELGNLGDHKYLKDGVSELRIDVGPGYRLYYAQDGNRIILLLCGGDKSTQSIDINRACAYWNEYQQRGPEEKLNE